MIAAAFGLPPGAYQIRCQDGAVVVTKGDVRVMTVPLEGPAKDLYLEVPNDATLHDLALLRSGPVPEEISPPASRRARRQAARRACLEGDAARRAPASRNWATVASSSRRRTPTEVGCWPAWPLAGPGLFEVIVQVDDATPGTGIALLNAKGEPLDGIEFGREGKTQLAFGFGNPREAALAGQLRFRESPGAAGRAAAMAAAGRGRRIVEMLGQRRRRPLGPRARRARPSRVLANDRALRPAKPAIARIPTMRPATSACEACRSASSAG